jgi:hypothetical protein
MAALLDGFGAARGQVIAAFRERLEATRGSGGISLLARAYIGSVTVTHR